MVAFTVGVIGAVEGTGGVMTGPGGVTSPGGGNTEIDACGGVGVEIGAGGVGVTGADAVVEVDEAVGALPVLLEVLPP